MDEYRNTDDGSTGGGIEQHFEFGAQLYCTRTSEALQAVERASRIPALLWLLRFPLDTESDTVSRFMRRLEVIRGIDTSIPAFRLYGVEPSGTAYLAMDYVEGTRIIEKSSLPREAQLIFVDAVRIVADLHRYNTLVGDICEDSFLVDQEGRVHLIGVLGTFELEAKRTAALPAVQTLPFISPEQRSGTGSELASDVYALGILGYRLFTGRYPMGEKGSRLGSDDLLQNAPSPSSIRKSLPSWVDDILGKCLEVSVERRFGDAAQLLDALEGAMSGQLEPEPNARWTKTLVVRPVADGVTVSNRSVARSADRSVAEREKGESTVFNEGESSEEQEAKVYEQPRRRVKPSAVNFEEEAPRNRSGFYVFGGVVVAFLVVIAVVLSTVSKQQAPKVPEAIQQILYQAPPELQPAVNDLITRDISREQKQRSLQRLARSTDSSSYAVLSGVLRFISDDEIRKQGTKLVFARIEKSGLTSSLSLLENVAKIIGSQGRDPLNSPTFLLMLRVCDTAADIKERQASLVKLYQLTPDVGLNFAAAIAIDTSASGEFLKTLRDFLKRGGSQENVDEQSLPILLMSNRLLVTAYETQIVPLLPQLTTQELESSLRLLVDSESKLLFDVAREALRREIVPPFQQIFLRALVGSDSFRGSRGLRRAVVDASRGIVTRENLDVLSGWDDRELGKVLFAVMAVSTDPRVSGSALEMLAMRGIAEEPGASLVNWVRTSVWDYREKAAKSVGILANIDIAQTTELEWAFDQLMPFTGKGSLLKAVLAGGDPRLISRVVSRTAEITSSQELLSLLSPARDRLVRKAAVEALSNRNSLDVLHSIIKAYEKETDEEIRAVYREKHWVVRNREAKQGNQ